ncbi:MAG TPA: response regulator, partial [Clostridia bacterium]|nr:response regulator [Clostridia bacterium]
MGKDNKTEQITVMIVDDITNTREDIKKLLYFEDDINVIGEAEDGEEAIRIAEELRPDIILMDVNLPRMDGITATEHISVKVPESAIVIISIQGEQDYLRKAMAAGARDYLVKPFSSSDLSETIRRVNALTEKRRRFFLSEYETNEDQVYKKEKSSKTIVFFSGKGGTGKTSIACNFAVALAQLTRQEVALIDADLQGGDVS